MKKNVIAILLAAVMASSSIGAVPVMAAEATTQESEQIQDKAELAADEEESEKADAQEGTTEVITEILTEDSSEGTSSHEVEDGQDITEFDSDISQGEEPIVTEEVDAGTQEELPETDTAESLEEDNSSTDYTVSASVEADVIDIINEAKNNAVAIADGDETSISKASRNNSAEENVNDLIDFIVTNGTSIDDGWIIGFRQPISTNSGGSTIEASVSYLYSKGLLRFEYINNADDNSFLMYAIMDYYIGNKVYRDYGIGFKYPQLGFSFTAIGELNSQTYYPKKKLAYTITNRYLISDDEISTYSDLITENAFNYWEVLMYKAGTHLTWIGFPNFCLHDLLAGYWNEDYTVDVQPTAANVGYESIHCSVCDAIKEGTVRTIPKRMGLWKKSSTGWWYDYGDGTYPKSKFESIGGKIYYFNASGYMVTGWQKIDGKWYYFSGSGAMVTGWQSIGGKWYYFDENGVMEANEWVGNYYLGAGGAMVTGWQKIGGVWYYFSGSGAKQTGWQKISNTWYYFDESGVMQTGRTDVRGKVYYFSAGGAMQTGWQKIDNKWYYFEGNGAMAVSKWVGNYYLTESGEMAVNQWIGKYYVGADGKWIPGYAAN